MAVKGSYGSRGKSFKSRKSRQKAKQSPNMTPEDLPEGVDAHFCAALMHSRVYISHQTLTLVKRLQVKCAFEVCKATSGKPKSFWKQALWAEKAQIELSFSVFFLFWGEQLIKRTLLQEICRINETNSWDWIPLNTNNFWMQMSSSQSRN